ncbi:MAG: flagellum-specific ATP synthase FliI [Gammaproteobacteria bacterium]|nr:MAG: flagellum-specific ATP synthase FliI [Pseudomonadota bacterium]PIE38864.1 MAG: flagellum-specific ATP synthase FliI [Gammaproteobacteria bacterium]
MNTVIEKLNHSNTFLRRGNIAEAAGTLIKATGLSARIGDLCRLTDKQRNYTLMAEVVGIANEFTLLTPLGNLNGVSAAMEVTSLDQSILVPVGSDLLGRVISGLNEPLDQIGKVTGESRVPLYREAPSPFQRPGIDTMLETGIKAIDTLLTVGIGQRLGIFAPAGGGKSTLLGMLARGVQSDINVIVLVGERGREVTEFIQDNLNRETLDKTVIVVATSDRPAIERCRAVQLGITIAEYFRDRGNHVVLLMDSVTRYARALREIGLALGEPVTGRGFPPSVYSLLPTLFERAGSNMKGQITSFFTVLLEDGQSGSDPIGEEVRSLLDGHIALSGKLAAQAHYPAIDVLRSASRTMHRVTTAEHRAAASTVRRLMAKYIEVELLIQIGEYVAGQDRETDDAISRHDAIKRLLQQDAEQLVPWQTTEENLLAVVQ